MQAGWPCIEAGGGIVLKVPRRRNNAAAKTRTAERVRPNDDAVHFACCTFISGVAEGGGGGAFGAPSTLSRTVRSAA